MAVTESPLTSGSSTTNASSYNTASITPSANVLILVAVLSAINVLPNAPTLSGNSLTYVQIATVTFNTIATPLSRLTLFRAMGASPSTGPITIDFGGQTQGSCLWSVAEFAGVNTGGTNGSAAIVQSATNQVNASASALTVTLGAFSSVDNATYGAFGSDVVGSFTPGTDFSEIHDVNIATPSGTLFTEWKATNDTSVDATPNTTADMGGIAVEIAAAGGGSSSVSPSVSPSASISPSASVSPSSSVSPSVSPSASVSPSSSVSPSLSPSASVSPSSSVSASESPSVSPSSSESPSVSPSASISPSASVSPSSSVSPSVSPSASISPSASASASVSPSASLSPSSSVSPSLSPSASVSPSSSVSPSISPSASLSPSSSTSASASPSAAPPDLEEISTHFQALGIALSVFNPLALGGTYLADLTNLYTSYTHKTLAVGGYWTAQIVLNLTLVEAEDWYENGLGRQIKTYNPAGVVIWEGFVNQVTLNAGALSQIRGPLMEVANRVSTVYSPLDVTVYPPVSGTTTVTTIAENTASQAQYGIIEKVVSAGTTTDENAEKVRDVFLNENRNPKTSGQVSLSLGSAQNTVITLDCIGNVNWLTAYIYNNASTAFELVSDKIIAIIAADPNSYLSASVNEIEENSFLTPAVENRNRFAWDILTELVSLGNDVNDTRRLFGVYADRVPYYTSQPKTIAYHHRLTDPAQAVTTPTGALVYPWDVQPGKWLHVPDFLIGRSFPASDNLADDPRNLFIESVDFTAPATISISGETAGGSLNQLLAKLTFTGGLL